MKLAAFYGRTTYRAGSVTARLGHRSASGDAWLARHGAREAAFLTAWNPLSKRHPPGWNMRRQHALNGLLRRHAHGEGVSGYRHWQEHNLLVAANARVLMRAAIRFRQVAILLLRRGQPARMRYNPRLAQAYRKR